MNRRWQTNLLLAIIVAILVLIAILRPGVEKPQAKPRISAIQDTEIQKAVIERPRAPTIVLERKGDDNWLMLQPRAGRTNPFMVSSLLRIIRAASERELPPDAGDNLDRYGLDNPRAVVTLDDNVIRFGDNNPVSNHQYILFNRRVYLIDHRYFWAASRPATDFLSKRLIEAGRHPTSLRLPGLRLDLVADSWHVKPEQKDIKADRIKQLVDDWTNAQALAVKPYDQGRVTEWVRIQFRPETGKDKPTVLRFGIVSRSPELILYRPDEGLQYHFPQDLDKRLFSFGK